MELIDLITIIGRATSQPFLFLTYTYYWRATKFHYLYRMTFMNYLISLIISNFWNIWAIYKDYHNHRPNYIFHTYNFIELTLVLWTNVLCFHFWQSIKKLNPISSNNSEERKTYIKCLIYVWSCSVLYTIVGFINDIIKSQNEDLFLMIKWVSFVLPVFILLSNVFMMLNATITIIREMNAIKKVIGSDTMKNNDNYKKKMIMYCKLFMVTIVLLCSKWFWFRLDDILQKKIFNSIFKYLMVANSFQGICIYLLFTFKKERFMKIKIRVSEQCNEQTTISEVITSETPN